MSNNYIGDIAEDADAFFVFDTADASGASITATVVVADIEVYRQTAAPINLTQRSSTSGFTLDADHDGTTGTHMVCIDTSDDTDAGFFTTGYDYFVKLNTVTVDGVSISKWIGHFSIENRYTGADVVAISGDTAAADNLESMLDGTGGVTLSLGNLVVASSGGTHAVTFTGHGAGAGLSCIGGALDGNGIECGGDGVNPASTGAGVLMQGGTTQIGLEVLGGGTSGDAIKASATDGHGMFLDGGTNNEGFEAYGDGTAAGMAVRGGSEGDGLYATSGWNAGEGIYAYGLSATSDGIKAVAGGPGKDINAAEIDSIISKVDVVDGIADNILLDTAEIGTAGDGLTAVPWNAAWDAEVQSECADALTAYDPPTKAEMDSAHSTTDALITTVDGIVDNILDDTAEIGAAGIGLTAVTTQVWSASVHPGSTGTGLKLYDISVDTAEIGTAGAGLTEAGGTGDHLDDLGGMSTAMKAEVNAEADTAISDAAIPAGVDTTLTSSHGSGDWTTAGGTIGSGADSVTLNIKEGGDNVPDAQVWVTSDSAGATVVAGTVTTNSSGDVTFMLDAGSTYYLWMQKDGYNSIQGQSFVAVAD
jgi:hypothetical protein